MSKRTEDLKKFNQSVSNELLKDRYTQDIGQKAVVERRSLVNDERTAELRSVIEDVGRDLQTCGLVTQGLEYRGSLTVHVYTSEVLRVTEFAPLTVTGNLPPVLGDAALMNLRNSYLADTGRRMQKKRSGF